LEFGKLEKIHEGASMSNETKPGAVNSIQQEFAVRLTEFGVAMRHGHGEKARVLAEVLQSMFAAPSEPLRQDTDEQHELCPYCDGSGESTQLSDNGPDAYEMPCNCPHCDGQQTLIAAYTNIVSALKRSESKYNTTYSIIWRRGLGDGDALTRMHEIADALKDSPKFSNALWAHDRLLELAATYEAALAANQKEGKA